MTLHSSSDHYWMDRQRDMLPNNRIAGLVSTTSVRDRSESRVMVSYLVKGVANAGKLIHSAVVRARQRPAGPSPAPPRPLSARS